MNRSELGAALRVLRHASGMEAKAVARSAVMSASKLSKIETGKLAPSADDVERILTAIGVTDDVKTEYMDTARAVATEATAWRLIQRAGLHKAQRQLKALEARMTLLRLFQPALVPSLLQTPEYMRAILSRHADLSEATVRETVSVRLERQEVLYDTGKTFRFVVTEPVLRWLIVPPLVMAGQLDRLISQARPPDSAARDVSQAVPPNEIAMFFRKPVSMRAGTFDTPVTAWEWLSAELAENPPPQTALPVETFLEQARNCLDRKADAYVGYYTAQGARFLVRALLTCPRDGAHCPEPPR